MANSITVTLDMAQELETLTRLREKAMMGDTRPFIEAYTSILAEEPRVVMPVVFRRPQILLYEALISGVKRILVVKPRKAYCTSLFVVHIWAKAITTPGFQAIILADSEKTVDNILTMTDIFDQYCAPIARLPKSQWDKEHRGYVFGNPKDSANKKLALGTPFWELTKDDFDNVVPSMIVTSTAKTFNMGRSFTPDIILESEHAHYEQERAQLLDTSIRNSRGNETILIQEGTPLGMDNLHYKFYQDLKQEEIPGKAIFYPHWWKEESQTPIGSLNRIKTDISGITRFTDDELHVIDLMKADGVPDKEVEPRIAWRRKEIAEETSAAFGDAMRGKYKFFQEHCENDVDCFVNIEATAFNPEDLARMSRGARTPIETKVLRPGFQLFMWKRPQIGERYIGFEDLSSGLLKGDFSVLWVANIVTGEFVAKAKGRITADEAALAGIEVAKVYNNTYFVPERTGLGMGIQSVMSKSDYKDHIFKEIKGDPVHPKEIIYGWATTGQSKLQMYTAAQRLIHENSITLYDSETIEQLKLWTQLPDKSYGVKEPKHDDDAMAFMGCCWFIEARPREVMKSDKPRQALPEPAPMGRYWR